MGSINKEAQKCLIDSAITHNILSCKSFFTQLKSMRANLHTIAGTINMIEGSGMTCVSFPKGTKITLYDALYSSKSQRNLLSFRDLRQNGYHVETTNKNNKEYIYLIAYELGKKQILEVIPFSLGLYYTYISPIRAYCSSKRIDNKEVSNLWHIKFDHPGTCMMSKIIRCSNGHPLKNIRIPQSNELHREACSLGKLII